MSGHASIGEPSPWVVRFAGLMAPGARVLDLACGHGRHARWLAARGLQVEAADRDASALARLAGVSGVTALEVDLEAGPWPFAGHTHDALVVTNYLFRPRFEQMLAVLREGGVLIYETFMVGNEIYGRPRNTDFLLQPNELLERLGPGFSVLAFEQGVLGEPPRSVVQRVCAIRGTGHTARLPAGA